MLKEHFRCVEPIIRFSMQFYDEPLNSAAHSERAWSRAISILRSSTFTLKTASGAENRRVNPAEAEAK